MSEKNAWNRVWSRVCTSTKTEVKKKKEFSNKACVREKGNNENYIKRSKEKLCSFWQPCDKEAGL